MKKSIAKNYFFNLINQALSILLPLITTPYLARIFGAEKVGIYSYTLSITTYFVLLGNLGVSLYAQKEIAYVQNDVKKRTKVFYEIFIMKFFSLLISTLLFYFILVRHSDYGMYFKIFIFELIANMIDITWFFQGMEEFQKTVIRNAVIKIIGLLSVFIFIKSSNDFILYFWIYVLSNFLGNVVLWKYIPKFMTKINLKSIKPYKHLKPCLVLFIPQIAVNIYTILDKTMIGLIVPNISEVGFYEQAQKIVKVGLVIITSFGGVMLPRMSNLYAKKSNDIISKSLYKSFKFELLISIPMFLGLIAISDSLIPLFLGNNFLNSISILKIISPILFFVSLTNVIGQQFLLPVKREKQYTYAIISGAIVNVILNIILISYYGANGAAVSSVIAEIVIFIIMYKYTKSDFDYKLIIKSNYKYLLFGIIMFMICYIIELIMTPSTICMIIQIICGMVSYISLLLLTKEELIFDFINKKRCKNES